MEDGDREKYHVSSVIQYFVFSSRKKGCIGCISRQVYNKTLYYLIIRVVGTVKVNLFQCFFQQRNYYYRLNHTSLLKAVLLHAGVSEDSHTALLNALSEVKVSPKLIYYDLTLSLMHRAS